jgi:hypothetical protein
LDSAKEKKPFARTWASVNDIFLPAAIFTPNRVRVALADH